MAWPVNRGLSLYLDLLRLAAALEVFAFHLGSFGAVGLGRFGWNGYGHEAVTVFFVLSGFVIRHAAEHSDAGVGSYAASRLTRVFSVALPCLLLTLVFDATGKYAAPQVYEGLNPGGSALLRLALGAGMLHETWVSVQMFSNTPYWSIAYEFWYYVLFAGLFYFERRRRMMIVALAALIAGPKIMLLFPIWLIGWWAYSERWSAKLPRPLAAVLLVQPVLALLVYERLHLSNAGRDLLEQVMTPAVWRGQLAWSRYVLSDSFLGVSVALHLVGAKQLAPQLWALLGWAERPIRAAAGRSFTLYLLHQPVLLCASAWLLAVPLGGARPWIVAGLTLAIVWLVAVVTEGQRHRIKPLFARLVGWVQRTLEARSRRRLVSA